MIRRDKKLQSRQDLKVVPNSPSAPEDNMESTLNPGEGRHFSVGFSCRFALSFMTSSKELFLLSSCFWLGVEEVARSSSAKSLAPLYVVPEATRDARPLPGYNAETFPVGAVSFESPVEKVPAYRGKLVENGDPVVRDEELYWDPVELPKNEDGGEDEDPDPDTPLTKFPLL